MEESQVKITLLSIGEVPDATAINRSALRRLGNQTVTVDMNVRVIPDLDTSCISLVVSCSYIATIGFIRTRILVSSVIATFEVEDLRKHIVTQNGEIVVAGQLMMTMLSIAVGALRGVVAVRTQGTRLRNTPLPIIDLTALMYRLHYGRVPDPGAHRL
ncbi:MAG: hypothetical protein J6J93_10275 [Muribaculaceae bacterium]|nr:hypothetical protein [Muribaculaceae bacterium]